MTALLALTLLSYAFGVYLQQRIRSPLLNATLVGVVIVMPVLVSLGVTYDTYLEAVKPLTTFLSPAVVALAIPMHRQRHLLKRQWRVVLTGAVAGSVTATSVGWVAGALLGTSREVHLALITASATSPVAIALAERLEGSPPLAATLVITAGLIGASVLPWWLTRLGVRSPLARGVTTGSVAHGIGTARIREEGDLTGAASSLGMGLGALVVTVVAFVFSRS